VAVRRLTAEVERLAPFYPTPDIPLFDGYDLEDDPEDPLAFYAGAQGLGPEFELHEATPSSFASLIARKNLPLPELRGELNSGKYGATFSGAPLAGLFTRRVCDQHQSVCGRELVGCGWQLVSIANQRNGHLASGGKDSHRCAAS